ncbi:MAG: ABC transporter substrate-binding protein [Gammaproteobacteria bacterium]
MTSRRKICGAWLAALILLGSWTAPVFAAASEPRPPRQLIMDTAEHLVRELRAQQAAIANEPELAYRLADRTVVPHIDFPRIARWVAGRYWRTATPEQRVRFTGEFREFLINTYVTAMINYAHDILANANNVSYPPMRPNQDRNRATVRMNIRLDSGATVAVDYYLHRNGGDWKIYDIAVAGISLVVTYRQTFSDRIASVGLAGVIKQLAERNAALHEQLQRKAPAPHR